MRLTAQASRPDTVGVSRDHAGDQGHNEGEVWREDPYTPQTRQQAEWRDGWRDASAAHEDRKAQEHSPENTDG